MEERKSITYQELLRLGRRDGWSKDIKTQERSVELERIEHTRRLLEKDPELLHIHPGDESAISSLGEDLQRRQEKCLSEEDEEDKKKEKRKRAQAYIYQRTLGRIADENRTTYEKYSKYSAMRYIPELKRFRAVRDFYTIDVDEDPQSKTIRRIRKVKKGELSGLVDEEHLFPVKPFEVKRDKLCLTEYDKFDLEQLTKIELGVFVDRDLTKPKQLLNIKKDSYLVYQWLDYDSSFSGGVVLAVASYNDICLFRKSSVSGPVLLKAVQVIDSSIKVIGSDIKVRKPDTEETSSHIFNTIIKYGSKIVCDECSIERSVEIAKSEINSKELNILGTTRISNSVLNVNYLDIRFDTRISLVRAISPDSYINITNSHISGFKITNIPELAYMSYVNTSSHSIQHQR